MLLNQDFKELLSLLEKYKVRYLVVGGYAVMRYAEPRFTKDLDIWVATDPQNADTVFRALKEFGAPLSGLTPKDFTDPRSYYQMGKPPIRVDILMSIPGVNFDEAWPKREIVALEGVTIPFISKEDLIESKKASGRPQDNLDLDNLNKPQE